MTPSRPASPLTALTGRLIVSCQAPPGDPMRDTGTLVRMARSAQAGGAAAVRVNEPEVVAATAAAVDLPVIGLWKDGDTGVYITPTVRHALALVDAGAAIVAADATARPRPDGSTFADLVAAVHAGGGLVMADVATADEDARPPPRAPTSSPRPSPATHRALPGRPCPTWNWSPHWPGPSKSRSSRRDGSPPRSRPPRRWRRAPPAWWWVPRSPPPPP